MRDEDGAQIVEALAGVHGWRLQDFMLVQFQDEDVQRAVRIRATESRPATRRWGGTRRARGPSMSCRMRMSQPASWPRTMPMWRLCCSLSSSQSGMAVTVPCAQDRKWVMRKPFSGKRALISEINGVPCMSSLKSPGRIAHGPIGEPGQGPQQLLPHRIGQRQ